MKEELIQEFEALVDGSIAISQDNVRVLDAEKFQMNIQKLAEVAALAGGAERWIRPLYHSLGGLGSGDFPGFDQ